MNGPLFESQRKYLEGDNDLDVAAVGTLLHAPGVQLAKLAVDVGVLAGNLLVSAPERATVDLRGWFGGC
jgi:hypothetical protein